jgi:hypothetical protein
MAAFRQLEVVTQCSFLFALISRSFVIGAFGTRDLSDFAQPQSQPQQFAQPQPQQLAQPQQFVQPQPQQQQFMQLQPQPQQVAYQVPMDQTAFQQMLPQAAYANDVASVVSPSFLQTAPAPQMVPFAQPPLAMLAQANMNSIAGTASVPVQDFLKMAESVQVMQATERSLQQELLQARSTVRQAQQDAQMARGRSAAAEANAAALGQSSRNIATMAEATVAEARKTMEKEKHMVEDMRAQLKESEASKNSLESRFADSQNQVQQWKAKAFGIQKNEDDMIRKLEAQEEVRMQDEKARVNRLGGLQEDRSPRSSMSLVQPLPNVVQQMPKASSLVERNQALDLAAARDLQRQQEADASQGFGMSSDRFDQPLQSSLNQQTQQLPQFPLNQQPQQLPQIEDNFLAQRR